LFDGSENVIDHASKVLEANLADLKKKNSRNIPVVLLVGEIRAFSSSVGDKKETVGRKGDGSMRVDLSVVGPVSSAQLKYMALDRRRHVKKTSKRRSVVGHRATC
jgi:hypothetical protein